jgi:hypothetical protein
MNYYYYQINNTASEILLYQVGAMRSVDWGYISLGHQPGGDGANT